MTRRGKIARLPRDIREQVNRRLDECVEGKLIAEWLNSLPKVTDLMAAEFGGQPVSEVNVSNWKLGGYLDWLEHQEDLEAISRFGSDAGEIRKKSGGGLADQLAVCLAARIVRALRNMPSAEEDPQGQLEWLRRLCADLSKMRKGDQNAESMRLKRERLKLDTKKFKSEDAIRKLERKQLENEVKEKSGGPITKEGWEQLEKDLKLI